MPRHLTISQLIKNDWGLLPFLVGGIAGLFFITLQVIDPSFTHFPGDLGDGRLNLYFLENAYRYFTGKADSFWNAPFMYPEPNVIAFSDNLLGSAPIYSFFRVLKFDIYTAYQWWFIVLAVLNYTTAYLFLRKLFRNNYAAVLGAMVFAFSMALQSQMTHAQTFPRFAIPLAFLMLMKFREELHPRYFFFTVLFVVYQIYCGIYLGFMLAIPVAILLVMIIWKSPDRKQLFGEKRWLIRMGGGLVINILLVLPLMIPYMQRNRAPGLNHYREILESLPTIKSYFFSQYGSPVWNFLSETGSNYPAWWDHQLFAGGIATLCILIFAGIQIRKLYRDGFRLEHEYVPAYFLVAGLITKLIYFRVGRASIYFLVYILPGFSSMRSLTRIINIELIFFAIATAFVFSLILKKNNWKVFLLFLIFTGLFVGDNFFYEGRSYRTEKSLAMERTRDLAGLFETLPEGTVISYEPEVLEAAPIYYHLDAMLAAQEYNLITVNGYSASCPHDFGGFWDSINAVTRIHWLSKFPPSFDSMLLVKSVQDYKYISWEEIENYVDPDELSFEEKLELKIEYIKTDKQWMKHIREKAFEAGITVDSMVKIDATWVLENESNDQ